MGWAGNWLSTVLGSKLTLNTWQGNHYSGSDGAEYATIFYDAQNAGYYVDPNGTSNLNSVYANDVYIRASGKWASQLGSHVGSGVIQEGSTVGSQLPEWTGNAYSRDCPAGQVLVGIIIDTRGTCENKCGGDGPAISGIRLKCAPLVN